MVVAANWTTVGSLHVLANVAVDVVELADKVISDELPRILHGVQRLKCEARTAAWWRTRSPPSAPGAAPSKIRLPPGGEVGE